jgi:hypothetical protein
VARDRDPQCKQCRREGEKLFLKGSRCLTEKCAIERRNYPPGHNGRGRIRQSEYLIQLREKQRARRYYGVLEKQFRRYYEKASRQPGITGENLLRLLELRLDNVVTRLGFAASRRQGRQLRVLIAQARGQLADLRLGARQLGLDLAQGGEPGVHDLLHFLGGLPVPTCISQGGSAARGIRRTDL